MSGGRTEGVTGGRGLTVTLLETGGYRYFSFYLPWWKEPCFDPTQVEFWHKDLYGYFSNQSQEYVNKAIAVLQPIKNTQAMQQMIPCKMTVKTRISFHVTLALAY